MNTISTPLDVAERCALLGEAGLEETCLRASRLEDDADAQPASPYCVKGREIDERLYGIADRVYLLAWPILESNDALRLAERVVAEGGDIDLQLISDPMYAHPNDASPNAVDELMTSLATRLGYAARALPPCLEGPDVSCDGETGVRLLNVGISPVTEMEGNSFKARESVCWLDVEAGDYRGRVTRTKSRDVHVVTNGDSSALVQCVERASHPDPDDPNDYEAWDGYVRIVVRTMK